MSYFKHLFFSVSLQIAKSVSSLCSPQYQASDLSLLCVLFFVQGGSKTIKEQDIDNLRNIAMYFEEWSMRDAPEETPTEECLWDLRCSMIGIAELAETSTYAIPPQLVNSDLIELHFSQVRELYHNRTPNILQYKNIQNSVTLTQPILLVLTKVLT